VEYDKQRSMLKVVLLMMIMMLASQSEAQLNRDFYKESCPSLFLVVRRVVKRAVAREPRMGASLLRLFFHDCFVNVRLFFSMQKRSMLCMFP